MSDEIGRIVWSRTEDGFVVEMTGEPFRKMVEIGDPPPVCICGPRASCCGPSDSDCCRPAPAEK